MSSIDTIPGGAATSSMKMLRAMIGIGALCGLLIVLTYEGSRSRIQENETRALKEAIYKVLPTISETKMFHLNADQTFSPHQGEENKEILYAGYDTNQVFKGIAIEASGQGYADIIRVLYGYDPEVQEIIGIYILESKETPGLGDKIEKDLDFLVNFVALDVKLNEGQTDLTNTIVTVKKGTKKNPWEIDGITGATISSRAIGDILAESTRYWIPKIYKARQQFEIKRKAEQEL